MQFSSPAARVCRRQEGPGTPLLKQFVGDTVNECLKWVGDGVTVASWTHWPLVLYGPSGTGKSALAETVASHVIHFQAQADESDAVRLTPQRKNHGAATPTDEPTADSTSHHYRVLRFTAAELSRGIQNGIQTDSISDVRSRFCDSQCVIIDHLDCLAAESSVQDELCRLLDFSLARGVRSIWISQVAPWKIKDLAPGLRSRLSAGLVLPVRPPGVDARREIVRRLTSQLGLQLQDQELEQLAKAASASVLQLENLLRQYSTRIVEQQSPGDLKAAESHRPSIDQLLAPPPRDTSELLASIAGLAAQSFQLRTQQLRGPSRRHTIALARASAMYLARVHLRLSLQTIGQFFGNRDHSTVLYSVRKVQRLAETDSSFRSRLEDISSALGDYAPAGFALRTTTVP